MRSLIIATLVAGLMATLGAVRAEAHPTPAVRWLGTCPLRTGPEVRCGELRLPVERAHSSAPEVTVRFAVIAAPGAHKADPFLFLMGGEGPGLSVLNELRLLPPILGRDVIAIEQRGNGLSDPYFGCPDAIPSNRFDMIWTNTLLPSRDNLASCRASLEHRGIDLGGFNSLAAAQDARDLREALGLAQWNVYGVSYGGRVATTLARIDPGGTRTLLLDSPQNTGDSYFAFETLHTVGAFFDQCAASAKCHALFPKLKADYERAVARYETGSVAVTAAGATRMMDAVVFENLVVWALYSGGPDKVARLPAAIVAAADGDPALILALSDIFATPNPAKPRDDGYPAERLDHVALQGAYLCDDDYAFVAAKDGSLSFPFPEGWSDAVRRTHLAQQQRQIEACRVWGVRPTDPTQMQPPVGNMPALLLQGAHDAHSSPHQSRFTRVNLAHLTFVRFPWSGHAQIEKRQACTITLLTRFMNDPAGKLDTSCAAATPEPDWLPVAPHGDDGASYLAIIRSAAADQVATSGVPGRAVRLLAPGAGIDGLVAAGHADVAAKTPLTGREPFRIASQTKTFTAAAVLRLVETGRLDLDDPIDGHVSARTREALVRGGYDPARITIHQILNHTSGLYDYAADPAFLAAVSAQPTHRWTRAEQIDFAIAHGKPLGRPGERYGYSDTGYVIAGEIIERVTGKSQAQAYRELLKFGPLGLRATWFESLEPEPPGLGARAHQYLGGKDVTNVDPSFDLYGGGGLNSTLGDLATWLRALFRGGVFDKPETLKTMLSVSPAARGAPGGDYGLGLHRLELGGQTCWTHGGFWGSVFFHCPGQDLTFASSRYEAMEPPGYDGMGLIQATLDAVRLKTEPAWAAADSSRGATP